MGLIGNLGGIEREAGAETRIAIEKLEQVVEDLSSSTARSEQALNPPSTTVTRIVQVQAPRFSQRFTALATWVIPASTHGFGTDALIVQCRDQFGREVTPSTIKVDRDTKTVTITWGFPQEGMVIIT